MTFSEGRVDIRVRRAEGEEKLTVSVRSNRSDAVARALVGSDVRTAAPETLLTSVYALCPEAHRAAWLGAIAAARGEPLPQYTCERVKLESALEHLRFLAFDAPRALGLAPAENLKKLGEMRLIAMKTFASATPDFKPLALALRDAVMTFVTGTPIAQFTATQSLADLAAWMTHGRTIAARLFSKLWSADLTKASFAAPALTPADPAESSVWLAAPGFDPMAPTALGTPRLTGAFVRQTHHPLIEAMRESYGDSVRTLFAARLTELIAIVSSPEARPWVRIAATAKLEGTALVECARGLLIDRVKLTKDKSRAEHVLIVAPTEWNFAPGGPCEQLLSELHARDAEQFLAKARWVTTGLDACIPCVFDTDIAPLATDAKEDLYA